MSEVNYTMEGDTLVIRIDMSKAALKAAQPSELYEVLRDMAFPA